MTSSTSTTIYRQDYTPTDYVTEHVDLTFDLDPTATRVLAELQVKRRTGASDGELVLLGSEPELISLQVNGKPLATTDYTLGNGELRLHRMPEVATVTIETKINPQANTSLMGLYMSSGNFFTQCEAEGFRKITYFQDRPDVMATYRVTLRADKATYPVLLSNGNLIEQGDLPDGRHFAKWEDPFRKPSYLFALVAGNLVCREETFTLADKRDVLLQVWVEPGNLDKTAHAMQSLKNSIRWDESRFGLELDLDRFMIVAVGDFNMGAMENKGLNIFNTRYVLANPRIATDTDYANIEAVVGHEYFHNWTGDRVTCRDWFQLSLKEGLTVFRDQEFSADRTGTETGRVAKRIEDVRTLRQLQFPEDAGPMAHPVRPDSYQEINNFYTVTVYEKGAEVVRMYQTLLGRDGFRKGMDLYFKRHDGSAVTCNDFLAAMADANDRDLTQFENWYSQSGTPRVRMFSRYDENAKTLSVTLSQFCPSTPGQDTKQPFLIPFAMGLLTRRGQELPLYLQGNQKIQGEKTCVLELTEEEQTFVFENVPEQPVISPLRNFSAPVILDYDPSDIELVTILAYDSDVFNRWEASQRLALRRLVKLAEAAAEHKTLSLDIPFIDAMGAVLTDHTLAPVIRALALTLPSEAVIAENVRRANPVAIRQARQFMRNTIACALEKSWLATYRENVTPGAYEPSPLDAGRRSLKNLALDYLLAVTTPRHAQLAIDQFKQANNMTDRLSALTTLVHCRFAETVQAAQPLLDAFYEEFSDEALVVDKWFSLQATSPNTDIAAIERLATHPAFNIKNPNRARSLIFGMCHNNMAQFNNEQGYRFWQEKLIEIDSFNPQVAARLARCMDQYQRLAEPMRTQAQAALEAVCDAQLSRDTREIIEKILNK